MLVPASQIEIRRYGEDAASHSHIHNQLVLPVYGELLMEVGGKGGRVCDRHAAVIPAGEPHSFASPSANAFLVADLSADCLGVWGVGSAVWDEALLRPFVPLDADFTGYCRFLYSEVERFGPAEVNVEGHVDLLLQSLARRMDIPAGLQETAGARARRFIEDNLDRDLSVSEMAAAANTSVSSLHRLFAAQLGRAPKRYHLDRRMQWARGLLQRRDLSLAEVSLRLGYADQTTFTRAFKRACGTAPGSYRRGLKPG